MDENNFAVYMSREPIPTRHRLPFGKVPAYKQVCIIPFTRDGLELFTRLSPTPLEEAESIDMLRLIEHGYRVKMVETTLSTHAVDTADDLKRVEKLMADDELTRSYIE
jgi:3-deoxy-manno-octulosonate cytidylyltransferase (CMP-KDO synthetase)